MLFIFDTFTRYKPSINSLQSIFNFCFPIDKLLNDCFSIKQPLRSNTAISVFELTLLSTTTLKFVFAGFGKIEILLSVLEIAFKEVIVAL